MNILLALFFVGSVLSQTEDYYGCEDECACGNMTQTVSFSGDYTYTEQAGCMRKIMCRSGGLTVPISTWQSSEIPKPADAQGNFFFPSTSESRDTPKGDYIDLFSFFGMICDSNAWYATKYPMGINYNKVGGGIVYTGNGTALDGKKTKMASITC